MMCKVYQALLPIVSCQHLVVRSYYDTNEIESIVCVMSCVCLRYVSRTYQRYVRLRRIRILHDALPCKYH